jgi:hypothetical protein
MTKSLRKFLALFAAFLMVGVGFKAEAKTKAKVNTSKFYISKEADYIRDNERQLCEEVVRIVNGPENKNFANPRLRNAEFVIPEKNTNFQFLTWEDVPSEDAAKYMAPSERLNAIKQFNQDHRDEAKILMQKTVLDLDKDGSSEEILRYRSSDKTSEIEGTIGTDAWFCYVGDIVPSIVSRGYNTAYDTSYDCYLFSYKGKIFQSSTYGFYSFGIHRPALVDGGEFAVSPRCTIEFDPTQRQLEEMRKVFDKKEKREDGMREEIDATKLMNNNPLD